MQTYQQRQLQQQRQQTLTPHQVGTETVAVRTDVYPATVTFSFMDNPFNRARAIITADTVLVLVEGGSTGASVLYEGRLEDVTGDRNVVVATTADGEITIRRAGGCGCGSRLRTYRPFSKTVRMARVPKSVA